MRKLLHKLWFSIKKIKYRIINKKDLYEIKIIETDGSTKLVEAAIAVDCSINRNGRFYSPKAIEEAYKLLNKLQEEKENGKISKG